MPYKSIEKQREASRKYYRSKPEVKVALYKRRAIYAENNIAYIRRIKDRPCMDCGVKYPFYVMDLDHREDKKFNFNSIHRQGRLKVIEEIKKCDVVCANCHRIRTYNRRMVDVVQRQNAIL